MPDDAADRQCSNHDPTRRPQRRFADPHAAGARRSTLRPLADLGGPPPVPLLILGGVAALMLSARAPGAIGEVGERVSERVRAEVPESTQARESARVRLERAGLDERDTLAHIGLWAGATLLVGLATWSWRSLAGAVVLVVAASTALELAQETLSPTRITEWSDVLANLMGIAVGVAAVVALNSVSGLPARVRRSRERS